jgi:nitrate/TMAO reductase-like tetraheme cytochrome c subunit
MKKAMLVISGMVLLALFIGTALNAEEKEVNEYVGDNAKKCGFCHKEEVAAWKEWPMAKSWDNLSEEEQKKDECIECHVTGYGAEGGWVSFEETPELVGIQCEACHGPMGDHMKAGMDEDKRMETVMEPNEKNCRTCHKEEGNPNFIPFDYEEAVAALSDHISDE